MMHFSKSYPSLYKDEDKLTHSPYSSSVLGRESKMKQFDTIRSRVQEEEMKDFDGMPAIPRRVHSIGKSYANQFLQVPDFSPFHSTEYVNTLNNSNNSSQTTLTPEVEDDGKKEIVDKVKTVDVSPKPFREGETSYLDGVFGLALIMIFNRNFASLTWLNKYPNILQTGTATQILRSPMGLILFFLVISRRTITPFFREKASLQPVQWSNVPKQMVKMTVEIGFLASFFLFVEKLECSTGSLNSLQQAETTLDANGISSYPVWCEKTSVQDILASLVRLFTNFNNQQQFNTAGMLWSIPVLLWGTFYTLLCLPIILPLSVERRFGLYAILCICLGFTSSPYLPFFVGMVMTDLRASGLIKRLQNTSRIAFLSIEVGLAAFTLFFLVHMSTQDAIVDALAKVTFNQNGTFGVTFNSHNFDHQPVNLIRAFVLFLWIEMSVTFQWIIGNFFFKGIGRVGMAFYVAQLPLFYVLIPALTKRYHGNLYWEGIIDMFAACFILNYVFGWILTHTVQKMGKMFGEWMVRTMMEKGTIALILQGVNNTFHAICSIPALLSVHLPNYFHNKIQSSRNTWHAIRHWRTPTPIVPPPSHPFQYGLHPSDLHSTLFDADISNDEQAVRTRKLLRFWSFMSPVNAAVIPGIAIVWGMCNPWHKFTTHDFATISTIWRVMWLFALPYCLITWLGYAVPDITRTPAEQLKRPVKRELIRNFYILSVTRGSNPEATRRAHEKLKVLEQYHPAVRVCVLTDEPYIYPDLDNIVCPKAYKSPLGLAKHKARALDYFRSTMKLGPYDFVLHMDEESTMDPESLRGCFDFIRYSTHHIGQGIIIYNGHNYWANWKAWLFAIADTIRVGDDLARFSLQGNWINRPVFGIHGSFLLLNGEAENVVGWDFASLAEDFEFSQSAWMKGFTLGRIHGIVREQSPENFVDFMKQRRRWYMGIRQIKGVYHLPQIAIKLWTAGIFCLVATVVNAIFSLLFSWSGPSPLWVYILSTFCFGAFQWLYLGGLLFQELDYGYKLSKSWQIPLHFITLIFIQPIMATVEGCAVIWAMSTEDGEVGFQVVKK